MGWGFWEKGEKNEPQATKKFFGAAILQKCCRGVGEQPTFAEQMKLHNQMQLVSQGCRFFPNHAENPLQYH